MPVYKPPTDATLFLLSDVLSLSRYANLPGFAEATPDMVADVIGAAGDFVLHELRDRHGAEELAQQLERARRGHADQWARVGGDEPLRHFPRPY